jgi:hypothetical protein
MVRLGSSKEDSDVGLQLRHSLERNKHVYLAFQVRKLGLEDCLDGPALGCLNHEELEHGLAPSRSVEHVCHEEIGMVELATVWNVDSIHDLASCVHQSLYRLCETYFSATSHGRNTHQIK